MFPRTEPLIDPPPALPPGWLAEPAPDGTTRVTRTAARRGRWAAAAVLLVLTGIWGLGRRFPGVGRYSPSLPNAADAWIYAMILCVAIAALSAVGLVYLAWALDGQEEWRVRQDYFEVRRSLFGHQRLAQYSGATLNLEIDWWSPLLPMARLELSVPGGGDLLFTALFGAREARALGAFLSAQTGWPVRERPSWAS